MKNVKNQMHQNYKQFSEPRTEIFRVPYLKRNKQVNCPLPLQRGSTYLLKKLVCTPVYCNMAKSLKVFYYISELLDGLFQILDDPNQEIKKFCKSLLGELLKEISTQPVEN
jgi:hypothetical protein